MFDPAAAANSKAGKAAKKKAIQNIKDWSTDLVPQELRTGLIIDVNEIVCGDPNCAPVDTVFTLVWESGGKGVFAIPAAPHELEKEDVLEFFPDEETLGQWHAGKRARWPPLPQLRFKVGERVECRIGPHPVKGWAPGRVVKLHYSEPNWPPNMVAPYQIALHDGRLIFAPQDTDQVIRMRPPAAPDAPSSPEYVPAEDGDDDGEEDEGEDDDGADYEGEEGEDEGGEMEEGDEGDEEGGGHKGAAPPSSGAK